MFTVNKNPSDSDLRRFGLAMIVGFFFIGALLFFAPFLRTRGVLRLDWTGTRLQYTAVALQALGTLLWLLSVKAPRAAKPVYIVWMTIAATMGRVMSAVVLTVLFVLLLPVFSLIVRAGDPLRRKLQRGGSYWEDYKPHEASLDRMKRPF